MFKKLTKSRLVVAVVAVTVAVPATAMAIDTFDDVPTEKFYHGPVEWAFNNNITTGSPAGADTFKPEDPVTRGESVTFLKRYNDNIVQPGIADVQADADAAQADADANAADIADLVGLYDADSTGSSSQISSTTPEDVGLAAVVTIPEGHTGIIEATLSAESACSGGTGAQFCRIDIVIDGTAVQPAGNTAFDSTNEGDENFNSGEVHSITRSSEDLPAGTYTVTANKWVTNGAVVFWLDDMHLAAEIHLTS